MFKSKKYSFNIFIDVINQFNLLFLKNNYLNIKDYYCFFMSERFNKNQELLDILKRKKSLELAYNTLNEIKDKKLAFYFAFKNNTFEYGFIDILKNEIYKIGQFNEEFDYIKKIINNNCFKVIRKEINNFNINDISLLHNIKKSFKYLFKINPDVKIIDNRIICNSYNIEHFHVDDRCEQKLTILLTQWCEKFPWNNYIYTYVRIYEKDIKFFIKIK